jgi:hypothetical protein
MKLDFPIYYTYRHLYENVYECTKWEENRSLPLESFELKKARILNAKNCSCLARVPCRHLKALAEMPDDGLWNYFVQDEEWDLAYDFPTQLKFMGDLLKVNYI